LGLNVLPDQGPVLGSVTLPISELLTSLTVEHFNQFASIALQPNSFYWIDLNISGPMTLDGPSVGWGTTADNSGPGVSEGYNSSNPTDFFFFPNNRDGGEEAFQMEVASVPEPSTWAMMLMGFAGIGFSGYRRARGTRAE
jgi:PEP-CTERM motif